MWEGFLVKVNFPAARQATRGCGQEESHSAGRAPAEDHVRAAIYQQASEAHREYLESKERGDPPDKVERLRLICEAQFQAATDYNLHARGTLPIKTH